MNAQYRPILLTCVHQLVRVSMYGKETVQNETFSNKLYYDTHAHTHTHARTLTIAYENGFRAVDGCFEQIVLTESHFGTLRDRASRITVFPLVNDFPSRVTI